MSETNDSPVTGTTATATAAAAGNGGSKRYKQKQPPLTVPTGCHCFRLLCHTSRIGGVIGKSGVIIKQLQQETSAKIRVEDPLPGSDDRVITIIGNNTVNKTIPLVEDATQNIDSDEGGEGSEVVEVSTAQEALVRVFERILLVAAESDGGYLAPGGVVSCRLLTDKIVIGSVIGKGGKVIEKIRKDTGCKIRVLVQDKLPACALPTDEMIEMEGDILAVKRALITVSRCLQESPFAHKIKIILGTPNPKVSRETGSNGNMDLHPPTTSLDNKNVSSIDSRSPQQEVVFRMLYDTEKVGILIGKSGTSIQAIENESGANIAVGLPVPDCDLRLITITAMESPESRSAAQAAVILIFNKSLETALPKGVDPLSSGTPVSARLLITPSQKGCLLGKGGCIIADMRKVTGAVIKIVGDNNQVPKCALENDQVVMMSGEFVNVRDALYSVTGRLRNNFLSSKTSNSNGNKGTHTRGNNHSKQHTNLTQNMDNLKLSNSTDRHWQSQDIGTVSNSVKGGTDITRSAIVTNMSVEIIVPQNAIGSVYGENGSNLTRLREISGAKVVVHEPHSGSTDHIIVISGTPDETQSAQSLLQAFILADQS